MAPLVPLTVVLALAMAPPVLLALPTVVLVMLALLTAAPAYVRRIRGHVGRSASRS